MRREFLFATVLAAALPVGASAQSSSQRESDRQSSSNKNAW
jgi:hypothetical protein